MCVLIKGAPSFSIHKGTWIKDCVLIKGTPLSSSVGLYHHTKGLPQNSHGILSSGIAGSHSAELPCDVLCEPLEKILLDELLLDCAPRGIKSSGYPLDKRSCGRGLQGTGLIGASRRPFSSLGASKRESSLISVLKRCPISLAASRAPFKFQFFPLRMSQAVS